MKKKKYFFPLVYAKYIHKLVGSKKIQEGLIKISLLPNITTYITLIFYIFIEAFYHVIPARISSSKKLTANLFSCSFKCLLFLAYSVELKISLGGETNNKHQHLQWSSMVSQPNFSNKAHVQTAMCVCILSCKKQIPAFSNKHHQFQIA